MKKQRSITSMMTIIFSVTILLQVAVLLSIVYLGRVPQKIREESYKNFDKNIDESTNSVFNIIDSKLINYLNLEAISSKVVDSFGSADNIITSSKEQQLDFLETVPEYLIGLLLNTDSNGAYIILENNNEPVNGEVVREGLYIYFERNIYSNDRNFQVRIMDKSLNIEAYDLSTDYAYENFKIDLDDDNNRYYTIFREAPSIYKQSPVITARYQELCKEKVINISYPIMDSMGNCVGIVGAEVLLSQFLNISPSSDITYVLGYTDSNSFSINPVVIWGKDDLFQIEEEIKIEHIPSLDKYYSLVNDDKFAISINRLGFFKGSKNPYSNENWVFLGITNKNNLISSANFIENVILIIITLSLVFGALMIYITVTKIVSPIKRLSAEVKAVPNNQYFEFSKSDVEEVNNLILNFEKLSYDILQYSKKITNAINTFLLGIYFYQNKSEGVYCTQAFLEMCGADLQEGQISEEEFETIYKGIIDSYYDKKYEAYSLATGRWVKLETKLESSFTLGILTDITEQVNEVRKMEKELEIDGFTKLYNRIAFQKLATKVIENNQDKVIAVIMWDMDNLKYINDRYGHEAGDRYLMIFADTIRLLEDYNGIVARRSGDEFFAIIYSDNKDYIIKAIEKIRSLNNQNVLYITDEITEKIRASFGLAWYPENGKDLECLLAYADKKLYQSKFEFGRFSELSHWNIESNINLFHFNKELAKITNGDYVTFAYQPIVDAKNGEIFGYEMLMRIFSDILNNPKRFIDIARENDKLDKVEELTFQKGFENYKLNINNIRDKKIFLNSLSSIELKTEVMQEILEITNNDLSMLIVELTGLMRADKAIVATKIKEFKNYNAQFAIDNFKHEFIEKIKTDNIDYLKVDISIINNIESSLEQQKKLEDIVEHARLNNYKVIAVGIKNYEELAIVINKVDYVQGYYLAEPTVKPSNIKKEVISEIKCFKINKN